MTAAQDLERDLECIQTRSAIHRSHVVTVVTASVGALLLWVIAHPVAGTELIVGTGADARTVGPGAVVLVSLLAGLAAMSVAALLARRTSRARRNWRIIAGATLALSMLGPLGAVTSGAGIALAAMHVFVGLTLLVGIDQTLARRLGT